MVSSQTTGSLGDPKRNALLLLQVPENHWLLQWDPWEHPRHPAYKFLERISHMRVGEAEVQHYLSTNRSSVLNQRISATQGEYGTTPAIFSQGVLRRNSAGIGFKNKAVATQELALASNWSSTGRDAPFLQLFTWNAGNLSRRAKWTQSTTLCANHGAWE